MAELAITTHAPGQEGIVELTGLGTERGVYCLSVRGSERTDMATFMHGINRDDVIEVKRVADYARWSMRGLTDYSVPSAPHNPRLDTLSGVRVYITETPHTLTPDIFISHYSRETNLVLEMLKSALGEAASTLGTVGFSGRLLYEVGQEFQRTPAMGDTFRRIPELPGTWNSMGGQVVSSTASSVAEQLIEGMPCSEEVAEFAKGLYGRTPTEDTIRTANMVFKAATQVSAEYDFYIDEAEGSLGFMLRLNNGLLLLAELSPDGVLSGGTYVDKEDEAREVKFLPNATVEEMIDLF